MLDVRSATFHNRKDLLRYLILESSAMRFPGCQKCDRLWSEYAKATYEHVSAESKLRLAALEQHVAAVERLTLAMEEALYQRESTREAIRRHEASHPQASAPSTTI